MALRHILPGRQPGTLLFWTCVCPEKTQGSFCDPPSTFKPRVLFESTPDNEKENQTLSASLHLQLEHPALRPPETYGLRSQEESKTSFPCHLSIYTILSESQKRSKRRVEEQGGGGTLLSRSTGPPAVKPSPGCRVLASEFCSSS